MYQVVRDNKQILKYRGLLTPDSTILEAQESAVRLALINMGALSSNNFSSFSSGKENDPNKIVQSNPFMRLMPEPGGSGNNQVFDFYFPYTPQSISYSDLSDEVAEIARVGTTPIVTFKSHKLMRVSIDFLVAVPYDGIIIDVEDSLNILRNFSTNSQRSVVFYHLDEMLTRGWQYRKGPTGRPPYFTIADLSIDARQRNSSGKITQALVRMTFVENQNPNIVVTKVPPFAKKKKPKPKKPKPTPTKSTKATSYTSTSKVVSAAEINRILRAR